MIHKRKNKSLRWLAFGSRGLAEIAVVVLLWSFLSPLFGQDGQNLRKKAQKLWKKGQWRQSALLLDRVLAQHPDDQKALLFRVKIALAEKDGLVAQRLLKTALKKKNPSPKIFYFIAKMAMERGRFKQSFSYLKAAQKAYPQWYKIALLRGWIYLGKEDLNRAYGAILKAKRLDPTQGKIYSSLGYVLFRKRKKSQARQAFQKAIRLNFRDYMGHVYLGEGLGVQSSNGPLRRNPTTWKKIKQTLDWMEKQDYERAILALHKLLKQYPTNATLYSLMARAIHRKNMVRHRIQYLRPFQKLSQYDFAPKVHPKGLRVFFTNFSTLSPREKRILSYSTAPLQAYIPRLISQRIRHHLLPMEKRISELSGMSYLKYQYGPLGRRKGDVRGISLMSTVTGRENLWTAGAFDFNTLAHELAHQIQIYSLSYSQRSKIGQLYRKALRKKKCLDFYAAYNDREYFAQGYEAFVSRYKRPGLGPTARHTRAELQRRDPGLYRFLKQICQQTLSPWQLAEIYFYIGMIRRKMDGDGPAKKAFLKAIYLASGIMSSD